METPETTFEILCLFVAGLPWRFSWRASRPYLANTFPLADANDYLSCN